MTENILAVKKEGKINHFISKGLGFLAAALIITHQLSLPTDVFRCCSPLAPRVPPLL